MLIRSLCARRSCLLSAGPASPTAHHLPGRALELPSRPAEGVIFLRELAKRALDLAIGRVRIDAAVVFVGGVAVAAGTAVALPSDDHGDPHTVQVQFEADGVQSYVVSSRARRT
jgi:hypothetical protein